MNNVTCDRSYWPEGGTKVAAIPSDLNDLWDTFPDQATTFVAEALADRDDINAHFHCQDASIQVYLWSVGGDTLTVRFDLKEEIKFSASDYYVRSEPQAQEVLECVQGLQALEGAVRDARVKLESKLAEFKSGTIEES